MMPLPEDTLASRQRPGAAKADGFEVLRSPVAVGRAVRAGEYHDIAVRVTQPALPVVRAAVTVGRIAVARQDDLGLQFGDAGHRGVEVVDLEPQQDAVA